MHVSQLASILGLEAVGGDPTSQMAWDAVTILTSWMEILQFLDWDVLLAPTPARDRPFRHLGPHTFHPIELLPLAWREGRFDWRPWEDKVRVDPLQSKDAVLEYCETILRDWQLFLIESEQELDQRDPHVVTPRGEGPFSMVMSAQRNHAAYHHRQIIVFIGERGIATPGAVDVARMPGVQLPDEIW